MSKVHPAEQDDKDKDGEDDKDTSVSFEEWLLGDGYGKKETAKRDHRKGMCGCRPHDPPRCAKLPLTACAPLSRLCQKSNALIGRGKNPEKIIQLDIIALVIVIAYTISIVIMSIAVWCYKEDSRWNSIVYNKRAFPTIQNENFFGGKHLFIYDEEGLLNAKKYLLRENRWLEVMHLFFMGSFLLLTVFQLAAYLTRCNEDHSKVIISYYTVFGGLGLIVALFPMLSWSRQENSYKVAAHYLQDFARNVWKTKRKHSSGLTNATAQDAWTLAGIMKFCYEVSQDGTTIDEDDEEVRSFSNYKRWYRLGQLQHLGFCTRHKLKILNTILGTVFALLCCGIPCICYHQTREEERLEMERAHLGKLQRIYFTGTPPSFYDPEEDWEEDEEEVGNEETKPLIKRRLASLSAQERHEIEKWKLYVEDVDVK